MKNDITQIHGCKYIYPDGWTEYIYRRTYVDDRGWSLFSVQGPLDRIFGTLSVKEYTRYSHSKPPKEKKSSR